MWCTRSGDRGSVEAARQALGDPEPALDVRQHSTPASEVRRPPSKATRTALPAIGGEPDRTKAPSATAVAGPSAVSVPPRLGIDCAREGEHARSEGRGWTSGLGCAGSGLGQYEQAFRDNDIDAEVLPELTADDLSGLGVASVGHRRKLLDAIAALRAGAGTVRRRARRPSAAPGAAGRAAEPRPSGGSSR